MVESGLEFEKKKEDLTRTILDFFEQTRFAYLSAREDKGTYQKEWAEVVDKIRDDFDSLNALSSEIKNYLEEKTLFDKDAKNPESIQAKRVYEAVKDMRFQSDKVSDPFSKKFGDEVIDALLDNQGTLVSFLHYALRSHSNALPRKVWAKADLEPDELTNGVMGLDLAESDLATYIIEHYGAEGKDSSRIKSKVKGAMKLLDELYNETYSEDKWQGLLELDLEKAEKSEEEKAEIDFMIPNKPMYRIFEIDDMKQIKGLSGEYLVQEKYDGMRIQLHKKGDDIKIYSTTRRISQTNARSK